MKKKIAIIGAGASGLAAAWAMRGSQTEISIFEKSRGVSGRAASRTRNGVRFDHGANYFKTDSPEVKRLVLEALPIDDLVRIEGDVWTFDGAGTISPGDPKINAEPKWTYTSGISTLGKLLADSADADIHNSTSIDRLRRQDVSWQLSSSDGEDPGTFDAVLLTPPAPQTAGILRASELPQPLSSRLCDELDRARYHRQFSIILAVDGNIERPGDFFALVNTDRRHEIAWLSFENDKPGRVQTGETVVIVQMSPDWSAAHFDDEKDAIVESARAAAAKLLGCELTLKWADTQRWKFAHPFTKSDPKVLAEGNRMGLFFAGDALAGQGRVPRALETGLEAARQIASRLELEVSQ